MLGESHGDSLGSAVRRDGNMECLRVVGRERLLEVLGQMKWLSKFRALNYGVMEVLVASEDVKSKCLGGWGCRAGPHHTTVMSSRKATKVACR